MHSILRPNKETGSIGYISHSSQLWSVILGHVLRIRIIPSILKRGLRRIHSCSNGLIITSGNIGPGADTDTAEAAISHWPGQISHVTS